MRVIFHLLVLSLLANGWALAEDWPTYQHDTYRSATTSEQLTLPLHETWRYCSPQPPQPAWPDPAKKDYAAEGGRVLRPRTTYDRAFHTVAVGGTIYFGSSADDRIVALDAATGEERWSFLTGGPVRLAPTIANGNLYVGSDDGYVYCLKAGDGALVWKYAPAPETRLIPGNGRLISSCPVRTSALFKDNKIYVGIGIFPEEGVYLCALNAATGAELWKDAPDPMDFINKFSARQASRRFALSPQGYLLASDKRLYIPTGRTSPVAVDFATGNIEALLSCPGGEGGTYALLTPEMIVTGPGTKLTAFDPNTQDQMASFPGRCIIVRDEISYLLSDDRFSALNRAKNGEISQKRAEFNNRRKALKSQLKSMTESPEKDTAVKELTEVDAALKEMEGREYLWQVPVPEAFTMILAGDLLFVGVEHQVLAFRASTGEKAWEAGVQGKAYGLAAANGRLLISTDKGVIHCYQTGAADCQVRLPARTRRSAPRDDALAAYIVDKTGVTQGYCLDFGSGDGALAEGLAQRAALKVVAVGEDRPSKQITSFIANLIVFEQTPCPPEEAFRLLRPCGGTAFARSSEKDWAKALAGMGCDIVSDDGAWIILRRGPLAGAGEWTHQYADAGNTACSGDALVHSPARLQWFGLPGPRPMVDRHHRAMPPLVKDGRLFVPGDDVIIAADAYNGTPLWEVETPNSRRLASPRDSGQMVATGDWLYATVQEECWALDVATGKRMATFRAPQHAKGDARNWGYIASVDDLLFGSGQKPGASYTVMNTLGDFEIQWGDFKRLVTSDYLFCLDRHTGKELWKHKSGVVPHSAIAIGSGRMYFIESHSQKAKEDPSGRNALSALWDGGASLVALDMRSGKTVWEKPVDFTLCQHIIYLSFAKDTLLVLGSGNKDGRVQYYLWAFDAPSGDLLWQGEHPNNKGGIGGDHGEQIHHPAIVGDVVYAEPVAYALRTGARVNPAGEPSSWNLLGKEGCGTISASADCLFYRDGHPCIHDLQPGAGRRKLNHVTRTGCWINMIPADGLILIPEASSGCSCPYPLQTSLAYVPE